MTLLAFLPSSAAVWAIVGILLLISEVLSGDGVLLAFGVSGLILAGVLKLDMVDVSVAWQVVSFAALGIPVAILIRRLLKKTENHRGDINTY